jgi:hypothetical protein
MSYTRESSRGFQAQILRNGITGNWLIRIPLPHHLHQQFHIFLRDTPEALPEPREHPRILPRASPSELAAFTLACRQRLLLVAIVENLVAS